MASMWKRRLAAMLMVGRKTKVLMVGRRSLATSEPMGASGTSSSRGRGLCEPVETEEKTAVGRVL